MPWTTNRGVGHRRRAWPFACVMVLLGAIVALEAPPAAAQNYLGSFLESQRYDNLRRHQQRLQQQRQQRDRVENGAGLSSHQQACARRYRTYDPRTDLYVVRPGVTARCRL